MFGYVTPCKMELKLKDYEKFKSYYCGLCKAIKNNFGNVPRFVLNYDMTFLAILLHSIDECSPSYELQHCMVHPLKKKLVLLENEPLKYAAFCNVALTYFKLIDNINDDNSLKSKILTNILRKYINKDYDSYKDKLEYIEKTLNELYLLEKKESHCSIDELSHPFAHLTGYILSSYITEKDEVSNTLYDLGYNLGKWIYIIDAWDDLEKDMSQNKFNAINSVFNKENKSFEKFKLDINDRIDFILTLCGRQCLSYTRKLPIKKNEELLYNILQFGLMEKMDKILKRSEMRNGKSI
ncbi:hypothetical protein KQI86_17280 [Clostridium sp. MSJ-11]|uniref:Uncharacterized protein n=1 Tax=Clostridium mobile TaxID=2841512 RepID=A0ABS6ELI5_9CLOT|nr:DUF5685 family protein [Clostridium mobile]MBU5486077.1 hypothetical protein [Clostridium mobile]